MPNRSSTRPAPSNETEARKRPDIAMVAWTRAVALFTFLLVITSAIANFFIYKQWQASIDAQADTREQMRAVVSPAGITFFPANFQNGKPAIYGFAANFENLGATRTNSFSAWVSVHYFPGSVPNSQDFSKPYEKLDTGNSILGPNSVISLPPVTLTSDQVEGIKNNLGFGVIWGHADWSDIFNRTNIQQIDFCLYLIPQLSDQGVAGFKPVPVKPECNRISQYTGPE